MRTTLLPVLCLAVAAEAQELHLTTTGYTARPQCSKSFASPSYYFQPFSYSLSETVRYATSIPSPTVTRTYAPAYKDAAKHLTTNVSTTTWGSWLPGKTAIHATDTHDPYGQAAWSSMWLEADLQNYTTTGMFSTTVSPTPVPTSELVLPPRDYFGPTDCYDFPRDFVFGVAGSAAQIEGAIAMEGRSPSLLEKLISGDKPKDYVTNENYFLYKQDIERIAAMGVEYYSFTIPWTRILPFVLPGTPVNKQAIDHYNDLINTVLDAGMQPVVTMLHFDSPLMFVASDNITRHPDIGYNNAGYQNETFVDAFVNYGKILVSNFADRVPIWVTFNEPLLYSFNFQGVDNVVHAHAQVYRFYHEELKATGKMGIKFNDNFGVPKNPKNSKDVQAANRFNEMQLGFFANPIFLGKQYPDSILKTLPGARSLNKTELEYIGHTADFFGIDPYTATVVSPAHEGISACAANSSTTNSLFPYCVNQETKDVYGWNIGYRSESYVYITPTYFREYLSYLWNTFRHPILVSEFGFPVWDEAEKELSDQLFDSPRSTYYLSFMSEILRAIYEDGVHVMGALAWSFVDNWEFGDYSAQFGLQVVNRTTQDRFYKKSFFDLVDFVKARQH
ncbi:CAZyme family GH1 [Penicillium canariense]|uniref:CAZyme family GH1 n=1 Tax=Penicillium canariense TaxID=189055 RepID=A0A9W9HSA0_9EURO|nr:CAZyme family GH1 [Penicillium canariense]KAJ5152594.1 CAZyme family GH1 [Penicillium canariense]